MANSIQINGDEFELPGMKDRQRIKINRIFRSARRRSNADYGKTTAAMGDAQRGFLSNRKHSFGSLCGSS